VNWEARVFDPDGNQISPAAGGTPVTFNLTGVLTSGNITVTQAQLNAIAGTAGTWDASGITLDFGTPSDPDRLSGGAELNSAAALSQNGAGRGSVVGFSVSQEGLITGVFSNGRSQAPGQVALATFNNPVGLQKAGNSLYLETVNSGK